jgi:hypothetical protein
VPIPTRTEVGEMTRQQRKGQEWVQKLLGPGEEVSSFAFGRAHARMTSGAWSLIAIFGTLFVIVLVALKTILLPGVLLIWILYGMVRPRRGVAVARSGIVVAALSGWNGAPKHLTAVLPPDALRSGIRNATGSKVDVQLGDDLITLKRQDFESLLAAVPDGRIPPPPPGALRSDV